ncbi:uncharacterized protein LOC129946372 [Eupeodes corollae]|uniref:uncharacterized protein LOC129946372 n=1 Tax=Eupeodes corollae TaxID=290404 RepID=UPI002493834A|nr:uncharacterized protein LOC129946372 [Eupeodes corollae]
MSLEGAKIICLNADDDGKFETIPANGRTFKFGYYMDCDVVLEHPEAMGLQCVINCDAFGRVTIENRCSDQPITLDGKTLVKMRPLLHNTEICILDKKYLWHFDGNPTPRGFQMEDTSNFSTPSKQGKKPEQPPNSEPARKWRRPLNTRLTIHSFAFYIKAGETPKDVKSTADENKPLNIHERIIDADSVPNKRLSSSPPPAENIKDFIDLNTPKIEQKSFSHRDQQWSCCKLSETVITSYSPRETGIRQEKSFAVVQSPLATINANKASNISLGPFHHTVSPQTNQNYRPSMHLIDLITPKKRIPPASSPNPTLLKSTLKRNILKGSSPHTPQKMKKTVDISTPGSADTVYSVHSTDDESVIVLSDDCSDSTSPITKTPPRARTPQSLMKRAILSSAKKVAVNKKCLNQTESRQLFTPITSKNPSAVRYKSQSTPQRKSLGKLPSPAESLSAGKPRRSLVTSTPFRQRTEIVSPSSSSRRSLALSCQSGSAKKESRNSLMLKQALAMTPSTATLTPKRSSVSCIKTQSKPRKSVSFLHHVEEKKIANSNEPDEYAVDESLNHTFTIEDDDKNDIASTQDGCSSTKNVSSSPKKVNVSLSTQTSTTPELVADCKSSFKSDSVVPKSTLDKPIGTEELCASTKSKYQASVETESEVEQLSSIASQVEIISENPEQLGREINEEQFIIKNRNPQSLESSKNCSKNNESMGDKHFQNTLEHTDYDYDGVDEIFKTPKAKNVMILSSPKSISLQKTSSDSVELIHSTEFDLSVNLDQLFQTPQSELITRRVDPATPSTVVSNEALSPEERFDMLAGRPITKKSYARKTPRKKQEQTPLKTSSDLSLPNTDIEEWIDNVNDILAIPQEEDEISYLAEAMNDISRDPLLTHSVQRSSNKNKTATRINTPKDEFEMTLKEEYEEEENKSQPIALKDPLETTVPRSLSPNISGIGLLDHTSESIFSETLALSDDASLKETEKSTKLTEAHEETGLSNNEKELNVSQEDKARKEIEEAFKNFEKQRKALDEKRLASTPEAKKPTLSIFSKRRTMGNEISSESTFDINAYRAKQNEHQMPFDKSKTSSEKNLISQSKHSREDVYTILSEKQHVPQQSIKLDLENSKQKFSEQHEVKTPEPKSVTLKDHKTILGSGLVSDVKLDVQAAKAERELELAFENFEEEPEFSERVVKTPEPKKIALKDHRRTLGSALASEVKLDLQAAKAERELELAFENFEEEPEFSEQRVVKTPEPKKVALKDHRRTLGSALVSDVKLDLQAAKAERELELVFENFEEEPEFSERVVKTPEPKKVALKDHRRTLGSALVSDVKLDVQAAKAARELELAFENFEEEPEFSEQRVVKTPEPKKAALKDHRRTLGSALVSDVKLDLQVAKAERELELAFENFEEKPDFSEQRVAKTPEPETVALKDHRRTLGTALVSDVKLDLQAAKAERELELAFENFEEEPNFSEQRVAKTPEPETVALKDHRRTLGSALVSEVRMDLQAAKALRELELAFENFEEEPEFSEQRVFKTPEPKKVALKDHRRTLGSALASEVKLDLQAAKAERELELAFENFEEEPEFSEQRVVKTPEPKKVALKDHRRTLGSALASEVKLDLQAAKAERELELAFENFEEEPEFSEQRVVKTPEPKKVALKDHRRTLGSALVSDVKLDVQAAKAERELELAFENFEEEPEFSEQRVVKTPEPKKLALKDHRRTLGSALASEVKLDLQAAKAERELELAFENFEEEPEFSEQRVVKTPEPKKAALKDHRRTLGSTLVSDEKLDLQAAKAERELELAFENFEEEPEFLEQRVVKTPEPKKVALKDHRRTLGSALASEVKLDLQAAKAERELELAFENFEEEPEFSEQRVVKTPEPKKVALKDHRRTLGSALVSDVKLDVQAAKAERELELDFENFEEEPEFSERVVKTPEPKKAALKDHRRTLGSALVSDVKLDLQAAKAERELELAFENFEEEPEFSEQRVVKTPEPKKAALKDHRRTLGSALASEVKLDLQAAKAERELELVFENFEEEPEFSEQRVVKTPEPKKLALRDHRRTLGSALVSDVKLDLQAAKAERELELAFENFEEEPEFSGQRVVKTPEPKKIALKDHRRTLGSALVSDVKLDLQAAKAERELELAFENFEEEPEFSEQRVVKTPEPKKVALKDHRRTLGSALVSDVKLDVQAAKAERELELAFENFEEEPEFSEQRVVKTPEPKKLALKDHRRTLGSALASEVKLDLQAAKAERELELAFENFEEEPEFSEQRVVKTPEPKKAALKDHRRTLGSTLVSDVKLDLQAAKAERELELAFENFEEEPEFSEQRVVKTPEPKKVAVKDHRRTLGSALVSEVKLDLQATKAERELELAFENFEDEPEFSEQRVVKTPEPKKLALKDHRRTLGSALASEVKLDLQAAKAERELELAFENFEEEPEFSEQRVAKTPEPKKVALKDHRRTLGSALASEVKLDLQAAKAERELELAFENFEEEPEFSEQRVVKTPEPKKAALKDHRRTLGSTLVSDVKLDLQAAKAERELELAFENFEEEPEFSEQRVVKTPEPKKAALKDHRRTLGSALVSDVKLDVQAAKTKRELELAKNSKACSESEEMSFSTKSSEILIENENLQVHADNYHTITETDELNENVASTISDTPNEKGIPLRSSRRRLKASGENKQLKPNPNALEQPDPINNKASQNENIKTTVLRRTRRKEVQIQDDIKTSPAEEATTILQDNMPQIRRTRQNSVDALKDDTKRTTRPHKQLKAASNNEESIKTFSQRIDSTDVDSTEDESIHPRKNRKISKIDSNTTETVFKEEGTERQHILGQIDEEEIKPNISDHDIEAKSKITLKAEADEIMSLSNMPSRSRIRGRKAQLNVVLIESSDTNTVSTDTKSSRQEDCKNKYNEINEVTNSKLEESSKDVDESIPSTPLPLNSGARRISKTKDILIPVPAFRKTRKGSVNKNLELQTVDSIETNADDEDIVPSTPLERKTRRRKLSNKLKKSPNDAIVRQNTVSENPTSMQLETTSENIVPLDKQNPCPEEMSGNKEITSKESAIVEDSEMIDCKNEVTIKSIQSSSIREEKPASSKVQLEPEIPTAKDTTDEDENNQTSSKNISTSTSMKTEDEITAPKLTNRRVGRSKAIKNIVLKSNVNDEVPTEENSKNDERISKATETPLIEASDSVQDSVKTSERRIAVKPENEIKVVKRGRRHVAEQKVEKQFDSKTLHEIDLEKQVDPVYLKTRGNKSEVLVEPEALIKSHKLDLTTECTVNTDGQKHNLTNIEDIVRTDGSSCKPQEIQNKKEAHIPLKTRGRRAAVKSENVVSDAKIIQNSDNEQISETPPLEGTTNHQEAIKTNVQDLQTNLISQNENTKYAATTEQTMASVPVQKRGRKAKIEPALSTPVIVTPVRKTTRKQYEEVPILEPETSIDDGENEGNDKEEIVKTHRHKVALDKIPNEAIIESLTPVRRGVRRRAQKTPESKETPVEVHEEVVESLPPTRKGARTKGENVQNALLESNVEIPSSRRRPKMNQKLNVIGNLKSSEHSIEPVESKGKASAHTEPHSIKSETLSTENSPLEQKTRQKRAPELCNDKNEIVCVTKRTRKTPVKLAEFVVSNLVHEIKPETLENESIQENSTPGRKRGRRVNVKNDDQKSITLPSKVGRQEKSKDEVSVTLLSQDPPQNDASCDLTTSSLKTASENESIQENSTPGRKRTRRANVKNDDQKSITLPSKVDRQEKSKDEVSVSLLSQDPPQNDASCDLTTSSLKTASENESIQDNSTPERKRVRRANVKNDVQKSITLPSKIDRQEKSKDEVSVSLLSQDPPQNDASCDLTTSSLKTASENESIQDNSTPGRKRVRRANVKNDVQKSITLPSKVDRQEKSKDEVSVTLLSQDPPQNDASCDLTTSSLKTASEDQKSDLEARKQKKATRGRVKSRQESTSNIEEEQTVCEQPITVKLQNDEITQENSTPTQKRSRRAIVKNDEQKELNLPRRVGRQGKTKDQQRARNEIDPSCEPVSALDETEEHSQDKHNPRVRDNSRGTSPPIPKPNEQEVKIEETQKKPTRGRGRAPPKTHSTLESTTNTGEEQTASATKPKSLRSRGRAPTKEHHEKDTIQEKISDPKLSNAKLEISQNNDEEIVDKKPTRARRAAAAEPKGSPLKSSTLNRTTRGGRKAAMKTTSDESDGPEQEKDTKSTLKRRNLEIQTNVNQEDTPSKRTRRKPIKLISDEFVT